jgi:anti-sigma28 factor (negative regulator of flagellin synthesis)
MAHDPGEKTLSLADYEMVRVIGEGSYGRAILCKESVTKEEVVIKEVVLNDPGAERRAEIEEKMRKRVQDRKIRFRQFAVEAKQRMEQFARLEAPFKRLGRQQSPGNADAQDSPNPTDTGAPEPPPPNPTDAAARKPPKPTDAAASRLTSKSTAYANPKVPRKPAEAAAAEALPKIAAKRSVSSPDEQIKGLRAMMARRRAELRAQAKDNANAWSVRIGPFDIVLPPASPAGGANGRSPPRAERPSEQVAAADQPATVEQKGSTAIFMFDGQQLELPSVTDEDSLGYRIEALRQFIENGIGLDKFVEAYQFVREAADEPDGNAKLKQILATQEQLAYYPLIQRLVVCEESMEDE